MACSVEVPYPVSDEPRSLTDDDFKFLMAYTGCYDRDVLQHRVLSVWREVKSKLWVFKCIQELMFLHPRIEKHPRTKDVLKQYKDLELSSEATNGFLMEVGSCFGTDLRWLILQGIAPKDLIATDLTPDYWIFGKQLFDDTDRLEVVTAFGSMADESLVSEGKNDAPLNYMRATVHNVWAGAVLHVLDKESIDKLLRNVHLLLRDGGVFFGTCVGTDTAGPWVSTPDGKSTRYIHSPASLAAALEEAGFSEVEVELPAGDVDPTDPNAEWSLKGLRKVGLMYYSATKPSRQSR